ncbi:MAG: hypothetical protein L6R43_10510 [Planctomycetes bacterium]|nr:hypothetical protein [Planctomycetota bacterium]
MRPVLLRRAGIFTALVALGGVLALLLSREGRPREPGERPRLPVVEVPGGTEFSGAGGVAGVSLVGAEGVVVSDVREIALEDGSRLPFRSMVLRAGSERPLPSPAPGVRSLALEDPDLELATEPGTRTRAAFEEAARARPVRVRALRGSLDQGPGEERRLRVEGGVRIELERDGVAWDVAAERADADLAARRVVAPGAVKVSSDLLDAEGEGLDASEGGGRLVLAGGARGTVRRASGARIGAVAGRGGDLRFACRGPFSVDRLPAPPPSAGPSPAPGLQWYRIVLREEASLEQGDGRLEGDVIEIDLARRPGGEDAPAEAPLPVSELRAVGRARLAGGGEGRSFAALCGRLAARPAAGGATEVRLEEEPRVDLLEEAPGGARRLQASCTGPAGLLLPRDEGPVTATLRGGARAVLLEEPDGGGPARRRELSSRILHLEAFRPAGGGPAVLREVRAEGDAALAEEERSARARAISWRPAEDGGAIVRLEEAVTVYWPSAGLMDPLTAAAGGAAAGTLPGSLLLAAPREAVLVLPPPGATDRGASVSVAGGAVLRRIVGEQEVYRLTCGRLEAALHPGNRAVARIEAQRDARLEGREENAGGRRYDLRGDRLLVEGDPGAKEPRSALLEGRGTPGRATASFTLEDGRPFDLAADSILFERATGAFRAEGDVRGSGVLPEGAGPAGAPGGRAEIACPSLSGLLAAGAPAAAGSTRLRSLDAAGPVWVKTATDYAKGDRLRWDAAAGALLLEGAPARIAARTGAAALGLEDLCEAPELRLTLAGGRLAEARAEEGGLLLRHRLPGGAEGTGAAPAERLQARCTGLLLYTPSETRLEGEVSLARAVRAADGTFAQADRLEGADRLRVLHPAPEGTPAAGGGARLSSAEALSAAGSIEGEVAGGKVRVEGVSRATLDAAAGTLLFEASADRPRFRARFAGNDGIFRRVLCDLREGTVTEAVGASMGGGR